MKCCKCGKDIPLSMLIDGKERDLHKRKYCIECVPFGYRPKRKIKDHGRCINCNNPLSRSDRKYCSMKCQHDYMYKQYIEKWKTGQIDGITGDMFKDVSLHIRRYLFEKYGNKCSRCGWSEINPFTNTIPLEIEHIDGNALNNSEENLILLCPNCHSLTQTYRGANRGKGNRNIKWVSRSGIK